MKKLSLAVVALACAMASAQESGEPVHQRIALGKDILVQLSYTSPEACKASNDATKKQIADGMPSHGLSYSCNVADVSGLLPFTGTVRDEYLGNPIVVATKTEPLCLNSLIELAKLKNPVINKQQYTVVAACKLRN